MADCNPLITPEFLHTVTGVDVSDTVTVESMIVITSTLIGEELGGCVDPAAATMKLRVVAAQYTAFCMGGGANAGGGGIRAEQVGDYRVEYQSSGNDDRFDLQVLRDMLASMNGSSNYSVSTVEQRLEPTAPNYEWYDHSHTHQPVEVGGLLP